MPPRKRDKEIEPKKQETKPDQELFIQAYEKPTQIYKFLRARFKHSPYFLYRNITYMTHRTRKRKSSRSCVKIDNLAERMVAQKRETSLATTKFEFLTIKYLGFFSKDGSTEPVKVDTLLMKVSNKKRKVNNCPVETKQFDPVFIPCNPPDDASPMKTKIVIPTENLNLTNGHSVKSYNLLVLVGIVAKNGFTKDVDLNGPSAKKRKLSNGKEDKSDFQYGTNLTVYDKLNRCLLPDGDYQLLMHELTPNSPKISHVNTTWETIPDLEENETSPAFQNYAAGPNLKLRLRWTNNPDGDEIPTDSSVPEIDGSETTLNNCCSNKENNNPDTNGVVKVSSSSTKEESNFQIIFQFLYSNNSRQQTEPYRGYNCPWCPKLDCLNLYSLLKHLKLCHARFAFTYTEIPNGARIDVSLNDKYDGSYIGASRDIVHGSIGLGRKRGPVRRAPVSKILVCHPKRPRVCSLIEFLHEKDDVDVVDGRAFISGHNRLYHHTTTCLPIYPKEMEVDSEDENDPKWLQKKTTMMIDDFTDVNDGEKELMKMWNLHVMKHGFVGDCQIPLASTMFLESRGQELLRKNLYRNFVLHMCNMFDFGLVSPVTVYTTIQRLQEMIGEGTEISTILRESWSLQRTNWLKNVHAAHVTKHRNRRVKKPVKLKYEEPDELKRAPHSFVIHRGTVGKYILELEKDFRKVMDPFTASNLQVMKKNSLKDFVSISSALKVSHMFIFTQSEIGPYLRIARLPQGPTLMFRIHNYSLGRDVISALKKQMTNKKLFSHAPLAILNNFSGDGSHVKLMASVFQNMFPTINVTKVKLSEIRRCVMLNYDPETQLVDFRHYAIKAVPVGLSRSVKKIVQSKIPNLSKYEDISEFLTKPSMMSDSEMEDDPNSHVEVPQKLPARGNIVSQKSSIRLSELGPRLTLQLIKVEEGLLNGEVLYHALVEKTYEEKKVIRKRLEERRRLKEERRIEQERNIRFKEKMKEEHKVKSLEGMKKKKKMEDGDDDDE
ncbi:hypothetical protein V9T40_001774 [Parthenolecanium corni]|uniref:Brix domain-containing protein n=1 Tax=Parthenolecanium corni TaxID=536013 RepID=A0AAN9Y379_9HEMI